MKLTYDKTVDALNFTLKTGKVAKTLEVTPEIFLDVDKNGNPLYLEIIGISQKIGKSDFSKIDIGGRSFRLPSFAL